MFRRGYKTRYIRVVLKPGAWKRLPMKLLRWGRKMPSTKRYNLVPNDDYDTRIPLHPDEAFQYGITFHAKYIGTMDVPRPTSRVEIVAAMRRVRYEFKAKGVKKRKVTIDVSTNGVHVTNRPNQNAKSPGAMFFGRGRRASNDCSEIMHHPIYRIFYVSHDSSDLKIFSYIARDGATNVFKCNVFKSSRKTRLIPQERVDEVQDTIERPRKKLSFREPEIVNSACDTIGSSHKLVGVNSLPRRPNRISLRSDMQSSLHDLESELESQAMRIVRTVGQAFEVCHKMQANSTDPAAPSTSSAGDDLYERGSDAAANKEPASECGVSESAASTSKAAEEKHSNQNRPTHLELLPPPPRSDRKRSQHPASAPSINLPDLPECVTKVDESAAPVNDVTTPLSAQHQLQLLRERLDQQSQQTQAAVAQLLLMRDQLAAEQAARCEAQARTHQLLVHNKELLEHIAALVSHLQDREKGNSRPISTQQLTMLPQSNLAGGGEALKNDTAACNGNKPQNHEDALINLLTQNNNILNNMENNNVPSPHTSRSSGLNTASKFDGTNNELIQNYLSAKLQEVVFTQKNDTNAMNKQYFQNCNAFPNIPPLNNHFSNSDLASLLTQQIYTENLKLKDELNNITRAMSASHLQSSMNCDSQTSSSKDSSPDGSSSDDSMTFIMPLSHKGTLKATDDDGKVRLIVPVSPSESAAQVSTEQEDDCKPVYGATLKVPADVHVQAPPAPITRSTSEKVPNRSEMMTALRSQWTRHTTK